MQDHQGQILFEITWIPSLGNWFECMLGHTVLEVTWAPKPYTLRLSPQELVSMPQAKGPTRFQEALDPDGLAMPSGLDIY